MGAYGADGWSTTMEERALGFGHELTRRQEREIDAALRERAEDEAREGADDFREWLVDNAHMNGAGGVALVCTVCGGDADLIADARRNLIAEYVEYRMTTFTDAEREQFEAWVTEGGV